MSLISKSFLKRLLIFQFALFFIFSKFYNINKSIKDFTKRILYIAKSGQTSNETIGIIESKSQSLFLILFGFYFFMTILALSNFNLGKQLTGMITIIMAVIYCNPLTTIKKNFEKNNYQYDWKIYIPSLEFCIISCLGIAMILSGFLIIEEEGKDINTQQEKEIKIHKREESGEKEEEEEKEEEKEKEGKEKVN